MEKLFEKKKLKVVFCSSKANTIDFGLSVGGCILRHRTLSFPRNLSWIQIHETPFSSLLTNGPNKLECYITLGWKKLASDKHFSLSYEENEVL
jgi:hypothetical protein